MATTLSVSLIDEEEASWAADGDQTQSGSDMMNGVLGTQTGVCRSPATVPYKNLSHCLSPDRNAVPIKFTWHFHGVLVGPGSVPSLQARVVLF